MIHHPILDGMALEVVIGSFLVIAKVSGERSPCFDDLCHEAHGKWAGADSGVTYTDICQLLVNQLSVLTDGFRDPVGVALGLLPMCLNATVMFNGKFTPADKVLDIFPWDYDHVLGSFECCLLRVWLPE